VLPANTAAELGPATFKWWKDWRGECVAIVASGPSTKTAKVELLRDRIHVIAIKENANLCPWADIVYGCDDAWWKHRNGLPEYKGLKLSYGSSACAQYRDIKKITIKSPSSDQLLLEEPGAIGAGGNSGFQAINLAVQFGVNGILLVGLDMHAKAGMHWYGPNKAWGMSNPTEQNFARWVAALTGIAPTLRRLGIAVVNASPTSALTCFPHKTVADALAGWGL
jgi:hypothetical protein